VKANQRQNSRLSINFESLEWLIKQEKLYRSNKALKKVKFVLKKNLSYFYCKNILYNDKKINSCFQFLMNQ
jgi:hypothetical protein